MVMFELDSKWSKYILPKGFVAVDGCSLTVGTRVQGSGCRVQGSGFRVQGAGFRVQGSGFRV